MDTQRQLKTIKEEAAERASVIVNHGEKEGRPLLLTVCGPCDIVNGLLTVANELGVLQYPQVTGQISCREVLISFTHTVYEYFVCGFHLVDNEYGILY